MIVKLQTASRCESWPHLTMPRSVLYLNTDSVITMTDCDDYTYIRHDVLEANFLPADTKFTRITYDAGDSIKQIVVIGTPEMILSSEVKGKEVLNG